MADENRDVHKDQRTPAEVEYERLMHRRKGISGSEFAGVGITFATTIVVFTLVGIWLDRRLGSSPWFLILMVFGGATLGFWSMYRRMTKRQRQ